MKRVFFIFAYAAGITLTSNVFAQGFCDSYKNFLAAANAKDGTQVAIVTKATKDLYWFDDASLNDPNPTVYSVLKSIRSKLSLIECGAADHPEYGKAVCKLKGVPESFVKCGNPCFQQVGNTAAYKGWGMFILDPNRMEWVFPTAKMVSGIENIQVGDGDVVAFVRQTFVTGETPTEVPPSAKNCR